SSKESETDVASPLVDADSFGAPLVEETIRIWSLPYARRANYLAGSAQKPLPTARNGCSLSVRAVLKVCPSWNVSTF
nr:hypothetical protein [Tanacetum cinerariifolium]